jgi:hypothetical protein
MNKTISIPQKKKFSIGSVFAGLSALAVLAFWLFGVLKTTVSAMLLPDASIMDLLRNLVSFGSILSFLQNGLLALSFLVLAILLLAKLRGPLLLAFPVLQVMAWFCGLISQVVSLVEIHYLTFVAVLPNLMTIFTGVLLLAGNLLFAVVVLANFKKEKKLTAFAYITPVAFGVGYGLETLTAAVVYLLNLFGFLQSYEMYEEHGLNLYMFVRFVLNFDTIAMLLYTILFTLTVFFACKWIVNPYKKGKEPIEEAPAEVIEEAAAEPSAKA